MEVNCACAVFNSAKDNSYRLRLHAFHTRRSLIWQQIVPFQQFGIRENSLQSLPSNWNMQYYRKIAVISFSLAKPRSISRVPREMPLFAGNYGIYRRKVRKERGEEIRQNEKCARGKNEKKSV